ncbi:class I SAM-dependent methyltransferase [Streptomyces aurantiogriseus]|uniref:Methyltransferase type 12 n=1 Tax=Streptomyces aurantiogriseus TaxID=66870 RepID=A0A918CDY6_9ACTN|nr:class I SAM-dependent methyltransferase [Streptomyces aurantiogriseus]GGR20488.1 methyltransferase type 12 [Streptomyces aurantiogriseus]
MPPRPIHEPRRDDCPWCGSRRLRTRLRAPDLLHHRPGTFVVDECGDCAHVFQNPRLTPEGLALYRRDPGEYFATGLTDRVLATRTSRRRLRATARVMLPFPEPESWLDVGTGHALFPEAAKEVFTYTAFDGLDPTSRVERARVAGRVEEAHIGHLTTPGITARLRARYDVVSILHHLEHTPDPRAELRAALTVLRPGGHLLLEVPDPQSAFAPLLGKWWLPHNQPRHLHLIPLPNLRTELERQGCTILTTDRRRPHIPYDLSAALSLSLTRAVPPAHKPLLRAATPLLTATQALDHTLSPLLRHTRFSNTYRIVARSP